MRDVLTSSRIVDRCLVYYKPYSSMKSVASLSDSLTQRLFYTYCSNSQNDTYRGPHSGELTRERLN